MVAEGIPAEASGGRFGGERPDADRFVAVGPDVGARRVPVVATPDLDRAWERCDPHRDRALVPYTDADTATIVDRAVAALVMVRAPMWLGDPGPAISVLVSLFGEAESRLRDAVADARDHGYDWDQVACRLAIGVATARRRYASYVGWRRMLFDGK
jgi:hypothetical protein